MNILDTTTTIKDKHYEIGFLWKTDNAKLPMKRELAENRFVSLEKRLERNPVLEKRNKETINQYISKGYVIELEIHQALQISCPIIVF